MCQCVSALTSCWPGGWWDPYPELTASSALQTGTGANTEQRARINDTFSLRPTGLRMGAYTIHTIINSWQHNIYDPYTTNLKLRSDAWHFKELDYKLTIGLLGVCVEISRYPVIHLPLPFRARKQANVPKQRFNKRTKAKLQKYPVYRVWLTNNKTQETFKINQWCIRGGDTDSKTLTKARRDLRTILLSKNSKLIKRCHDFSQWIDLYVNGWGYYKVSEVCFLVGGTIFNVAPFIIWTHLFSLLHQQKSDDEYKKKELAI